MDAHEPHVIPGDKTLSAQSPHEQDQGLGASPAEIRFQACRWRVAGDEAVSPHCSHRDVLPFAGTAGFKPEAWCPDCAFYKARRTPRKRDRDEYAY